MVSIIEPMFEVRKPENVEEVPVNLKKEAVYDSNRSYLEYRFQNKT